MGRAEKTHFLYTKQVAHRGLHDGESAENTLSAFEKAAKRGYAIETDIHVTKDNKVVVFHDHTLTRATDGRNNAVIEETDYAQLKTVKLFGTEETMPLLSELLKLAEGRSPLLIEFKKKRGADDRLETEADKILSAYRGEYAVQSFNPSVLKWYRRNRPQILRGQLSCSFKNEREFSPIVRYVLRSMLSNGQTKPDFISYCESDLPCKYPARYAKRKDVPVLAWTVRSAEEYERVKPYCDNIIFENFIPELV